VEEGGRDEGKGEKVKAGEGGTPQWFVHNHPRSKSYKYPASDPSVMWAHQHGGRSPVHVKATLGRPLCTQLLSGQGRPLSTILGIGKLKGYPVVKTASLCVPSFRHNTGV